ncbi:MAG: hypothetical protein UX79_C0010G0019 [candidate division WWE3 bacterium GW2011_GWB1_47_11]|uniref:Type II secretion system protein GspG C-terminal domain-containing protein n=3 Tax=Katanobacteria TaxID=422282 RepID=A0A0G1RK98_UNCKA|nr:MAG: hypothetical protein UX69_C0006G0017 [candidate division WWE3 bacterium GW2011_GWA2_46_9]KKU51127.1 MAG: hypothetical protein UX73_C0007G0019 [candidate division WWE3 bacterium GW2011_GWC1_47_10]KKU57512.1 MAG: hypothetical protein UX79_C0010G0019 [candidate division WWE3 bacterium GW2011_GWB1_47_11]
MALKILKDGRGVTFIELLLVFAVLSVMLVAVFVFVNPVEMRQRGRDERRLSDLQMLDRMVAEYLVDYGAYPDDADTLRVSTSSPGLFWINADLSRYAARLPTDPLNDSTYFYSYKHTATGYELNARLEFNLEIAAADGGNDPTLYELGNALEIL